jgi:hypothetical protein
MTAVDNFLAAIEQERIDSCEAWAPNCVADTNTPGGRRYLYGPEDIRAEYRQWFAGVTSLDALRRWPVPGGEIVQYTQRLDKEDGPYWAHHLHVLELIDGLIVRDTVFCGGQRPLSELPQESPGS